jgi:hypothetical protein
MSGNDNHHGSSDKLVPLKALTSSVRCRIFFVPRASVGSENNPAGCSADRTWQFLCEGCPVAVSSITAKLKIRLKASTQVWKVVGVILLVCGLQLYGQQTASGAEAEAKAATYTTFYPTCSATDTVPTSSSSRKLLPKNQTLPASRHSV